MTTSSGSPAPTDIDIQNTPAIHLEAVPTSDTEEQSEAAAEEITTQAMDNQTEQQVNTEMLSPPLQTVTVTIPTPSSQVFAPRPIRAPFPVIYRPIPQRLSKGLAVQLDESPMARSPSPVITTVQHRRSSSAASTMGDIPARWNSMNMKMLESKLPAAETSEAEEKEGSTGENNNLLQLYSPSKDVLDELYKIIRSNRSYPFSNFRELSANSPSPALYRTRTPTKTPSSPSQHRRQISDAATPDICRSPEREWSKIAFPSSPISRTTMRNPILFNAQFGTATAE